MATSDQSAYTLRYNEISGVLEAQIGLNWTALDLSGQDTGITQLTGAVTAGPGNGSQVATLASGIDAAKIANGTVSNIEFQYLDGVTSAIQTQLNGKQATGNYITALTGDVTASGPGSVAATLANTAVSPGSYAATNLTVDSKGRITAASNGTITAVFDQDTSLNIPAIKVVTVGPTTNNASDAFIAGTFQTTSKVLAATLKESRDDNNPIGIANVDPGYGGAGTIAITYTGTMPAGLFIVVTYIE